MLVSAALDGARWWIAGAILLSGFLVTFAAGRIFLIAFWRAAQGDDPAGKTRDAKLPPASIAVLVLLTLASTAVGLWPEPVAALSKAAASAILEPEYYLRSVFPEPRP